MSETVEQFNSFRVGKTWVFGLLRFSKVFFPKNVDFFPNFFKIKFKFYKKFDYYYNFEVLIFYWKPKFLSIAIFGSYGQRTVRCTLSKKFQVAGGIFSAMCSKLFVAIVQQNLKLNMEFFAAHGRTIPAATWNWFGRVGRKFRCEWANNITKPCIWKITTNHWYIRASSF